MNKSIIASLVALAVIGGGAFLLVNNNDDKTSTTTSDSSQTTEQESTQKKEEKKAESDIVELAVATDSLSTLVTAVKAADLVETLQGDGPFTVFAPTNDAFAALPAGTLDSLLLPENKETLAGILTYHVVSGKVMSSDLKDGQVVKTIHGENLTVSISGGKVMLKDAKGGMATVASADIEASNGVVHVIDAVVLPE
jgi:uncharacterized surface protein with fasciclin (FAS1) repeats